MPDRLGDKGSLLQEGGRKGGFTQKGDGGQRVWFDLCCNALDSETTALADPAIAAAHVHDSITCVNSYRFIDK